MSSAPCSGFTIRRATVADSDGILKCLSSAFEPFKSSYTPGAYADTVLDETTFANRSREMAVFVAIYESEIVGTIACAPVSNEEGHLRGMAVLPTWQGRGVAQRLLNEAESSLRLLNCKRITLDTTAPLKRAVQFYERNGFHPTGRVTDFYGMPLFGYEKSI